jgi:hypothetical protein
LSQSRTGSPPPSVRKKIAGTRFPGFSGMIAVYHTWYDGGREYPTGLRNPDAASYILIYGRTMKAP